MGATGCSGSTCNWVDGTPWSYTGSGFAVDDPNLHYYVSAARGGAAGNVMGNWGTWNSYNTAKGICEVPTLDDAEYFSFHAPDKHCVGYSLDSCAGGLKSNAYKLYKVNHNRPLFGGVCGNGKYGLQNDGTGVGYWSSQSDAEKYCQALPDCVGFWKSGNRYIAMDKLAMRTVGETAGATVYTEKCAGHRNVATCAAGYTHSTYGLVCEYCSDPSGSICSINTGHGPCGQSYCDAAVYSLKGEVYE
jgi:hypothetical protein